jgi:hypothetical protein
MDWAKQLAAAKGHLSAREVADAVSPLLSVRTVEHWLSGYRTPPEWTQQWIISRVSARKRRVAGRSNVRDQLHRTAGAAGATKEEEL